MVKAYVVKWVVKVYDNFGTYDGCLASYKFYRAIDAYNCARSIELDEAYVAYIVTERARDIPYHPEWETSNNLPF